MPRRDNTRLALLALFCAVSWSGAASADPTTIGRPLTAAETTRYRAIAPDGAGLPPGHGTAADGAKVYARVCSSCHGDKLQGIRSTGAPALIGGRGTLQAQKPLQTVESYWPYATTVFDYVKRAMPFNAPGSLTDDEVYAATAYILAQGHIIDEAEVLDATTLPKVRMPNADGFVPDPRHH